MRRVFLGWQSPALLAAVELLWQQFRAGGRQQQSGRGAGDDPAKAGSAATDHGVWDLSRVVLVLPGARVGRRLVELIAARAAEARVPMFPPRVTTVGQLPELLYRCRRPFATTLVQRLAWAAALRESSRGTLEAFLADVPDDPHDSRWWELGLLLWRQHRELAADGLDFRHVAEPSRKVGGPQEERRWNALAEVQRDYLRRLDSLELWDRQTALLFALEHRECQTDDQLFLIGTVDMNLAMRRMLDQVSDRVTALVFADAAWQDRFDAYGCVVPQKWQRCEIALRDDDLRQVDRPADQAREAVRALSECAEGYRAPQITVGVPDEKLVPLVQRALREAGVASRYGPGRSIEATGPIRLWRAIADYLSSDRVTDLLDILHHADVAAAIGQQTGIHRSLNLLEECCAEHLPHSVGQLHRLLDERTSPVADLLRDVERWLAPLRAAQRTPDAWVPPLLELTECIYGDCELDPEDIGQRSLLGGCEAWHHGMMELLRIPTGLCPPIPACQAILMALSAASPAQISAPPEPNAVELLGWLELPLDDAPVLIVTSMNEGLIPTSATSDLFLPDGLRSALGLDDNRRRYARDAYALATLARTRAPLRLIFARRDAKGNPLLPSRLLFATGDERRVARCLRFFGEAMPSQLKAAEASEPDGPPGSATDAAALATPSPARPTAPRLPVPRPEEVPRVATLNVTDFKLYLACPYRFYLSRVLGLRGVIETPLELDPAAFGSRMHEVLEDFGTSEVRDETDPTVICDYLLAALHQVFRRCYGDQMRPSLQVQQALLAMRLGEFAQHQARWRQAGWQIFLTEGERRSITTTWKYRDVSIALRGRIDRIDRHEATGALRILDYKSSETGRLPREAHHRGKFPQNADDWVDLQLPLYRHLAAELGLTGTIELGFINLPRGSGNAGFKIADWTPAELWSADQAAAKVVKAIQDGKFWPPGKSSPFFDTALDRICQESVFGAAAPRMTDATVEPRAEAVDSALSVAIGQVEDSP